MKLTSFRAMLGSIALLVFSHQHLLSQTLTQPQFQDFTSQPGYNTADFQFSNFSHQNYSAYPTISGTQVWPSPIATDGGASTVSLNKPDSTQTTDFLDGPSFGGGIYSFFSNTQYQFSNTAPIANLSSLTFQLYEAAGDDGASYNNIYMGNALPTLTLNLADSTQVILTGTPIGDTNGISGLLAQSPPVSIFGMSTNLDDVGFNFDLTGLSSSVSSYTLTMEVPQHSIVYGFDVTEAGVQAAPEPSTWAMMMLGGLALLLHVFRTRRSLAWGE